WYSPASSSTIGAMARQGPHHAAQKSINTGLSDFNTSESKLASVTSTMPLLAIHPPEVSARYEFTAGVDRMVSSGRDSILALSNRLLDAPPGRKSQEPPGGVCGGGSARRMMA